ncbi:MAG: SDR family NAD(P)-dependent oxidoreductase [Elusimicrobiota bacterium]
MDLRLAGKTALVTGSSRGIGRAVALRLAQEGARVLVTGRNAADVERAVSDISAAAGAGRARGFRGDLARLPAAKAAAAAAVSAWGRLDILVANIGSGRGVAGLAGDEAQWRRLIDQNLMASVRASQAVIPRMKAARHGSIVFIGSIAGLMPLGAPLAYEAAKAALGALSRGLARDLAADGIRVNTVAPGNILFPGGVWDLKLRKDARAVKAMLARQVPLRRFGTPEEIADAVAFVASPAASFMTGACLVVDGGQARAHAR